ncbi:MAG: type II secretion system protein [Planctomycetota bacterium]
MADPHRETDQARRWKQRRAYSLFELLAVLAIIGAVAGMAVTKFGHATYEAADAQGFARRMALDVSQTRRRAIASGDDHYLQFSRVSGAVV